MAFQRTIHWPVVAAACVALASAGCSDDSVSEPGPSSSSTGGAGDCLKSLAPTGDDQEAVQTALIEIANGGTICFAAGTFQFERELSLAQDSVVLRGAGLDETIFDFSGQTSGANGLAITGDTVTVEKLTVKNTPGDGVRATDVKDITFREMAVRWDAEASVENGAYGLYPVGSDGVRIEGCVVNGARDAGFYVGQSTRILVADSEAYGNVAGIEIENSTDAEVRGNHAHDNTAGILVFNLPNLPTQDGKRAKVHSNVIDQNNLANFAEAGTVVSEVPAGCGVVLLASDDNEFHDNEITNNKSLGIAVLHYTALLFGPYDDPEFDPYPQGNWIHDNVFSDNGTDPESLVGGLTAERPIPDVMDDGCQDPSVTPSAETQNCLVDDGGSYLDFNIPGAECAMDSTDPSEVTCEQQSLPPQDP
jgi:parallel beta-helix repeat protein